jgi:sulfatase modifying factor 1
MHGNAWEWCLDGKRTYQDRGETDPEGPAAGASRAIRGGSFYSSDPRYCRAAHRIDFAPSNRDDFLGFRVLVVR